VRDQESRFPAFLKGLEEEGLEAFLVTSPSNLCYLFGFTGSLGAALVIEGTAQLLVDSRYHEQAELETRNCRVVQAQDPHGESLLQRLPDRIRLGIEGDHLSFNTVAHVLEARPGLKLQSGSKRLELMRAVKSKSEIQAVRAGCRMALRAFESFVGDYRPGHSEVELAGLLEYHCRREGSEAPPFPSIVASGPRSALPHARPTANRVGEQDNLLVDFGTRADGYCSDLTRNLLPDAPAIQQIEGIVRAAQEAAIASIRAGIDSTEVDAAARRVITDAGYGECFGHGTGHGLGLEVHEYPRVSFRNPVPLVEGMVFTVEPGIYLPGRFGIRIEDVVAVTADGCEILSRD